MAVSVKTYYRETTMNTLHYRASPCTSQIKEHTPIYDLAAYNQRQRQQQLTQYRKNATSLFVFSIVMSLPISFLFIGR